MIKINRLLFVSDFIDLWMILLPVQTNSLPFSHHHLTLSSLSSYHLIIFPLLLLPRKCNKFTFRLTGKTNKRRIKKFSFPVFEFFFFPFLLIVNTLNDDCNCCVQIVKLQLITINLIFQFLAMLLFNILHIDCCDFFSSLLKQFTSTTTITIKGKGWRGGKWVLELIVKIVTIY